MRPCIITDYVCWSAMVYQQQQKRYWGHRIHDKYIRTNLTRSDKLPEHNEDEFSCSSNLDGNSR